MYFVIRQFVNIMENKSHMEVTCAAAAKSSYDAMRYPRQFDRPCLMTALATALSPALVPVVRTPLGPTIAACLGDEQSKLKVCVCVCVCVCLCVLRYMHHIPVMALGTQPTHVENSVIFHPPPSPGILSSDLWTATFQCLPQVQEGGGEGAADGG